ncbi:MAG: FAD binding domain-containing protein [Anaerolineales bacterium]
MIVAYHRPQRVEDALTLLARSDPKTVILGGGLYLNQKQMADIAVVDVQALGLNTIQPKGNVLILGSAVTLQELLTSGEAQDALAKSIRHQDPYNRRQVATLMGTVMAADGRSPFTTALLALDPILEIARAGEEREESHLGDVLPLREERLSGALVTYISIPSKARLAYEYVARSPADYPLVSAAVAQWPSGRTRVVLGGCGDQPIMVLDGPTADGAVVAARDAYSRAEDAWAGADYRSDVAGILVERCMKGLTEED